MRHSRHSQPEQNPHPNSPSLSDLPGGSSATVYALTGGKDLAARLASLGITPGAQLSVIQNFGHGPVMISVRDTRVALGRGEAHHVLVEHT